MSAIVSYIYIYQGGFAYDDYFALVNNRDTVVRQSDLSNLLIHDFWGQPLQSDKSHRSFRPVTVFYYRFLRSYILPSHFADNEVQEYWKNSEHPHYNDPVHQKLLPTYKVSELPLLMPNPSVYMHVYFVVFGTHFSFSDTDENYRASLPITVPRSMITIG
jgi:hypothetical protein